LRPALSRASGSLAAKASAADADADDDAGAPPAARRRAIGSSDAPAAVAAAASAPLPLAPPRRSFHPPLASAAASSCRDRQHPPQGPYRHQGEEEASEWGDEEVSEGEEEEGSTGGEEEGSKGSAAAAQTPPGSVAPRSSGPRPGLASGVDTPPRRSQAPQRDDIPRRAPRGISQRSVGGPPGR